MAAGIKEGGILQVRIDSPLSDKRNFAQQRPFCNNSLSFLITMFTGCGPTVADSERIPGKIGKIAKSFQSSKTVKHRGTPPVPHIAFLKRSSIQI